MALRIRQLVREGFFKEIWCVRRDLSVEKDLPMQRSVLVFPAEGPRRLWGRAVLEQRSSWWLGAVSGEGEL